MITLPVSARLFIATTGPVTINDSTVDVTVQR